MQNETFSSSKFNFLKIGLIVLSAFVVLFACSKSSDIASSVDCSGTAKSFTSDVSPVIRSSCASNSGCHAAGSNNGPGELLTYTEIFNSRSVIRSAVLSGAMPQNGKLTTAEKSAIICWIDNGASNN